MVITWVSMLPVVSEHGPGLSPAASVIPALPVDTSIIKDWSYRVTVRLELIHAYQCPDDQCSDIYGECALLFNFISFFYFFAFGSFNDTSVSFHSVKQIVAYPAVID